MSPSLISFIKNSLKTKVIILSLLAGILPLFIGMSVAYLVGKKELQDTIGSKFDEMARLAASNVETHIEHEITEARVFALAPEIKRGIRNAQDARTIQYLHSYWDLHKDEYKDIILTDTDGKVVASMVKMIEPGKDRLRLWKKAITDNNALYISNFYQDTSNGDYLFDLVLPVVDKNLSPTSIGERIGFIWFILNSEGIFNVIKNVKIGETGHAMLVNSEGVIFACPIYPPETHTMAESVVKQVTTLHHGWDIVEDDGHGGKNAIAGFAPVEIPINLGKNPFGGKKWYIFVSQSPEETYRPLNTVLNTIFVYGVFLSAIVTIAGYLSAQKIVAPIVALKEGAERLGKGNLSFRLKESSEDEVGLLTRTFNWMADTLHEREREIIRKGVEWENTFNSIKDIISLHDINGNIIRVNKAFIDKFDIPAQEVIGKNCSEIYHCNKPPWPLCPSLQTIITQKPYSIQIEEPRLEGTYLVTASPLFDENKKLTGSIFVLKDITDQKRIEQQLYQSEKLAAIGELVSGVAHELNNPLTSVIGYSELIMSRELDEKTKKDIKKVFDEGRRAARIVQNLLTFAREHKPEKIFIDINTVLMSTLELKSYELKANNIEVTTDLSPDLPEAMADYHQIQQVFLNIINNTEYVMLEAHRGGHLTITTRLEKGREQEDGKIVISFTDDGPGMAPENIDKIFNPFFTTKEVGKGTGLGLSICYGIVKEHGGRIYAKSQPGQGATFIIELPVIKEGGTIPEVIRDN